MKSVLIIFLLLNSLYLNAATVTKVKDSKVILKLDDEEELSKGTTYKGSTEDGDVEIEVKKIKGKKVLGKIISGNIKKGSKIEFDEVEDEEDNEDDDFVDSEKKINKNSGIFNYDFLKSNTWGFGISAGSFISNELNLTLQLGGFFMDKKGDKFEYTDYFGGLNLQYFKGDYLLKKGYFVTTGAGYYTSETHDEIANDSNYSGLYLYGDVGYLIPAGFMGFAFKTGFYYLMNDKDTFEYTNTTTASSAGTNSVNSIVTESDNPNAGFSFFLCLSMIF